MITVSEIEKELEIEEKIATYKKENERFRLRKRKSTERVLTC